MSKKKMWMTRTLAAVLAFVLCGGAEFMQAQQSATIPPTAPAAEQTNTAPASENAPAQPRPATVDPSRAPLTPVPATNSQPEPLPDAASSAQDNGNPLPQQQTAPLPKTKIVQPVGVGAAQAGPTAGGAATKPAGNAIAPAKQRQYRSLLLKVGAIAGAGIALGTVMALSKGSKSTPPGSGR